MLTCSAAFTFGNLDLSGVLTQHPAQATTGEDCIVLKSTFIPCVSTVNVFSFFCSQTSCLFVPIVFLPHLPVILLDSSFCTYPPPKLPFQGHSWVTPDLIPLMLVSCHLDVSAMTGHRSSTLPERQLPWASELSHSFSSPTSAVMSFQFPLPGLQVYFLGDTSKFMATNSLLLTPALFIAL